MNTDCRQCFHIEKGCFGVCGNFEYHCNFKDKHLRYYKQECKSFIKKEDVTEKFLKSRMCEQCAFSKEENADYPLGGGYEGQPLQEDNSLKVLRICHKNIFRLVNDIDFGQVNAYAHGRINQKHPVFCKSFKEDDVRKIELRNW